MLGTRGSRHWPSLYNHSITALFLLSILPVIRAQHSLHTTSSLLSAIHVYPDFIQPAHVGNSSQPFVVLVKSGSRTWCRGK